MNEKKIAKNNQKLNTNGSAPVTSPISQGKLVSRVNALTSNSATNPMLNPQNMVFNTEKGSTLNYKHIVDELISFSSIDYIADF